jgi:hypothetical protein
MSNAKYCDVCTNIFPEGQEGSESGIGTFSKMVDGRAQTIQQSRDTCAECVYGRQDMQSANYTRKSLRK